MGLLTRIVTIRALIALFLLGSVATDAPSPRISQSKQEHTNEKSLYSIALFASIERMEKEWGRLDDSDAGGRIRIDYHHLIVQKDDPITTDLPTKSGDYNVEYLGESEILARRKILRRDFATLKVFPIESSGDDLVMQVRVEWAELRRGKLIHAISDWSDVTFRYDCEKKQFVISEIKLGGI
jgi:hypothetical protein